MKNRIRLFAFEVSLKVRNLIWVILERIVLLSIVGIRYKKLPSSLLGYYNAINTDFFYKICIKGRDIFLQEKSHYQHIKNNYNEIYKIVPQYHYFSVFFNKIYVMKTNKLNPILEGKSGLTIAREVLFVFKNYSEKRNATINELSTVVAGLSIVKELIGEEEYFKAHSVLSSFLASRVLNIGPAHGDFHAKNIMKKHDRFYIIDLDCFRANSVQVLDALYYLIELIVDPNGISWFDAIKKLPGIVANNKTQLCFISDFCDYKDWEKLLLLLFVDRIGQEYKYRSNVSYYPKNEIIETYNYLNKNLDLLMVHEN